MQAYVGFEFLKFFPELYCLHPPTSLRGDCACVMTVMSASMLSSCGDSCAGAA